jgi:hypothetical protein
VYQPADWFSIKDTVPSGVAHFSSALLVLVLEPPAAAPVATVLASALPIFISVVSQPESSMAVVAAMRVSEAIFMGTPERE